MLRALSSGSNATSHPLEAKSKDGTLLFMQGYVLVIMNKENGRVINFYLMVLVKKYAVESVVCKYVCLAC